MSKVPCRLRWKLQWIEGPPHLLQCCTSASETSGNCSCMMWSMHRFIR
ncbi:unnamed protein product [Strongylus vulgaris]|uniref:Uncharacterized protein n=1 Tax=Strongylus vulgaris TaxID=40348 RepID=A0A3P7ILM4_STRVU|nr:unnamed protein product [Strongylus vulgaris]